MSKLLIFNFDGTSNEPEDAVQEVDSRGNIEDDNITNILKFHLLCGGDLKTKPSGTSPDQMCFYYSGVGTYGNFFQRLYNSGLSSEKFDVAKILWMAKEDLKKHHQPGDRILVTGFSRGAALARRFSAIINDQVGSGNIIESVFDTVASIGLPNIKKSERPKSEVVFEHGHSLPSNVKKALHCLSLDDKRKAFQPTLMNAEDRVHELWFAGAHSDVGGGYYFDGLADTTLRYMLGWIGDLEWDVKLISPIDIPLSDITDSDARYKISRDDVSIDPDVFGKNHQQSRTPLTALVTLTDRTCCVIQNDEKTNIQPLVHHSVSQRIAGDRNYVPAALKGVMHKVIYDDGTTQIFNGLLAHKEKALGRLNLLDAGAKTTTVALAHQKFNRTGLFLKEGAKYEISVEPGDAKEQTWKDASIECDANGWNREGESLGIKEVLIAGMEFLRRVPDADWFCLCGSIGDTDDTAFRIGLKETITASCSGELCLFANDLDRFYGNNFGKLIVTVRNLQ